MSVDQDTILEVSNLKAHFPIRRGVLQRVVSHIRAVDGLDFQLKAGETLGVVGESGSGKTTMGRCIAGLEAVTEGSIRFRHDGQFMELTQASAAERDTVRSDISMLFQDPNSSLNPRMRVLDIVAEPLRIHKIGTAEEQKARVEELLMKVGLGKHHTQMYPHQFSGGQRQRIGIARALAIDPRFLICDEPVSALDVSVQAQVLNLLKDLQRDLGLTFIFIAHDLSVVEYISDRVMVMYLGHAVEIADGAAIYKKPQHPYTEALLAAIPRHEIGTRRRNLISGGMPDPSNPPRGCVFHTRCRYATEICRQNSPALKPISKSGSGQVACHHAEELDLRGIA